MATYYEILGIDSKATKAEIEKAFKNLTLIYHPDKKELGLKIHPDKIKEDTDVVEIMKKLNEARSALIDDNQRAIYDEGLLNPSQNVSRQAHNSKPRTDYFDFDFDRTPNVDALNYYEYYNALFNLKGKDRIQPGVPFDDILLASRTKHVADLCRINASLNLYYLYKHLNKLVSLRHLFLGGSNDAKALYDISLEKFRPGTTDEAVLSAAGGRAAIQAAFERDRKCNIFAEAVFVLHKANLLTPYNFKKITRFPFDIANDLKNMQGANLLTQDNFDFFLQHSASNKGIKSISSGLSHLGTSDLLTQKSFEQIVLAGKRGECVALSLKALNDLNLRTDETENVVGKFTNGLLHERLLKMQKAKTLTKDQTDSLRWSPKEPFEKLGRHLHQLFAHGLFLLSVAPDQGEVAMLLALDLRSNLKKFTELNTHEPVVQKDIFINTCTEIIESKKESISLHRSYWTSILAKILSALIGIRLLTKRQTIIEAIHEDLLPDVTTPKP